MAHDALDVIVRHEVIDHDGAAVEHHPPRGFELRVGRVRTLQASPQPASSTVRSTTDRARYEATTANDRSFRPRSASRPRISSLIFAHVALSLRRSAMRLSPPSSAQDGKRIPSEELAAVYAY